MQEAGVDGMVEWGGMVLVLAVEEAGEGEENEYGEGEDEGAPVGHCACVPGVGAGSMRERKGMFHLREKW